MLQMLILPHSADFTFRQLVYLYANDLILL
jgi:hypothetical protein